MARGNYFIYGDVDYLIADKTSEILNCLQGEIGDFYIDSISSDISIKELLLILNTMPLGFYKRVVLLKNPKFICQKMNKNDEKIFLDYLKSPNVDTIFIFVLHDVLKPSNFIKEIAQECESFYIRMPSSEGLRSLFLKEVRRRKKDIEPLAIFYLLEKAKVLSLGQIINDIEKVCLYSSETLITKALLEKIAIPTVNENIFNLLDGVFEKNLLKAYSAWVELYYRGESAIKVIYQLIDNFKRLLLVRGLLEEGKTANEIEKILNKHSFVIKKAINQSKRLNSKVLGTCLSLLLAQDILIKSTSGINEMALMEDILVMLISKLSVI